MKKDLGMKILIGMVGLLLLLNLANGLFSSKPVLAGPGEDQMGRYQIAAWGFQAQNSDPRSGYYVVDTTTGIVVASKMEIYK
jgi:hypothetical protein